MSIISTCGCISRRAVIALAALALAGFATPSANAQYLFTNIADTATATPSGGTFTGFGTAAISGNNVAFRADYANGAGTSGVFRGNGLATTTIARNGDGAGAETPTGGTFTSFDNPTISGSDLAFHAFYTNGTGDFGIFRGNGATTTTVARNGAATPFGGSSVYTEFTRFPSISGANVVFHARYSSGGGSNGVFLNNGTTTTTVVRNSNATTPNGGTYTSISTVTAVDGSNVLFLSGYTGGSGTSGLFLNNDTTTTSVVRSGTTNATNPGDTTPNGGRFTGIFGLGISGSNIVFAGNYTGGTGANGIFLNNGATTVSLARTGTDGGAGNATPNGGRFIGIQEPAISGNTVAFRGTYTAGTGTFGIFASTDGVLTSVVRQGDSLFGSTVTALELGRNGIDGDAIAFNYTLADNRTGVAVASLGVFTVPEANAGLLALLALPALCCFATTRLGMIAKYNRVGAVVVRRRKSA